MSRMYDFITKANQVLLFLALVGVIAFAIYIPASEKLRSSEQPHVAIAMKGEEGPATEVRDVRLLAQDSDFFIFGIVKRTVGVRGAESQGVHQKETMGL